jgi:hypothetical protein
MSDQTPPQDQPGEPTPPVEPPSPEPTQPVEPTPLPAEPGGQLPPAPGSETPAEPPAAEPPRRTGGRIVAIALAVLVVLACTAGAYAYFTLRGSHEVVLNKVPASADAVVVAHLDPAALQKTNLFRLTEKFPDLGNEEQLTKRINDLLDQALEGSDLTRDDISWIGGEVGGYVEVGAGTPSFGVMIASDDDAAATSAMEHFRSAASVSDGTTYSTTTISSTEVWLSSSDSDPAMALFDGTVVFASDENAMRSIIDTSNGASSIQDDATFRGVMDRLPEDNLGFAYVNVHNLLSLVESLPAGLVPQMPDLSQFDALQGFGMSVTAEPDGFAIDEAATTDPAKLTQEQRDALATGNQPNPLLPLVPADSLAVLAAKGSGVGANQTAIDRALQQLGTSDPSVERLLRRFKVAELLGHLTGDAALQVGPATGQLPVGGTVMIGVDDAGAVTSWIDEYLPALFGEVAGAPGQVPLTSEDHDGVKITSIDAPIPTRFSWAVVDQALVIGVSPQAVAQVVDLSQNGGGGITTDPGYTDAISHVPGSSGGVVYVDVQAILDTAKSIVPADVYQELLDNGGKDLQPITAVVAGATSDEHGTTGRIFIEVP